MEQVRENCARCQNEGFINGKCSWPDEKDPKFEQWLRVDCVVRSWILNFIDKEIVEAFLYVNTARELWEELRERYGECNGPLLYQIQREISTVTQGGMMVPQYYTKLKKLWDELTCLTPVPECSCGGAKAISEAYDSTKLIQFLMRLNETYIRGQILLMELLPNANKAYSMVLRVEKQWEVSQTYPGNQDSSAFLARTQTGSRGRTGGDAQNRERGQRNGNKGRG